MALPAAAFTALRLAVFTVRRRVVSMAPIMMDIMTGIITMMGTPMSWCGFGPGWGWGGGWGWGYPYWGSPYYGYYYPPPYYYGYGYGAPPPNYYAGGPNHVYNGRVVNSDASK